MNIIPSQALGLYQMRAKKDRIERAILNTGANNAQVDTLKRLLEHVRVNGFTTNETDVPRKSIPGTEHFSVSKRDLFDVNGARCFERLADRLGMRLEQVQETNWATVFAVYPSEAVLAGPTWKDWLEKAKSAILCKRVTDVDIIRQRVESALKTREFQERATRVMGHLTPAELRIIDGFEQFLSDDDASASKAFTYCRGGVDEKRLHELAKACGVVLEPIKQKTTRWNCETTYKVRLAPTPRASWCSYLASWWPMKRATSVDANDQSMGEIVASYDKPIDLSESRTKTAQAPEGPAVAIPYKRFGAKAPDATAAFDKIKSVVKTESEPASATTDEVMAARFGQTPNRSPSSVQKATAVQTTAAPVPIPLGDPIDTESKREEPWSPTTVARLDALVVPVV